MNERKPLAACHYCGTPIYGADSENYADEAYYDGRIWFCPDCKDEYLRQFQIGPEMEGCI